MANPIETYRGVDIFHTADLTLVWTPVQFAFCCVLRESDEGPVLTMEASVEAVRSEIDAEFYDLEAFEIDCHGADVPEPEGAQP